MNATTNENLTIQTAGTLIALRIAVSALMGTHPEPKKVLALMKELVNSSGVKNEEFPTNIRDQSEMVLKEFASHLEKNIDEAH